MNDDNFNLCEYCGLKNPANNLFCVNCGKKLITKKSSIFSFTPKYKKPVVAGLLNLMFWGLGYYYIKINKVYMLPSFLFIILCIVIRSLIAYDSLYSEFETAISLLFAGEAYRRAVKQGDLVEK